MTCGGLQWQFRFDADLIGAREGLPPAERQALRERAATIHETFEREFHAAHYGFARLEELRRGVAAIREFAARARDRYEDILHIGIGGSALGATALISALSGPYHNLRARPRIWVLDNIDPEETADILDRIDPDRTLLHIVSKSGRTLETLAGFRIAAQILGPRWEKHTVVTTDPQQGFLRRLARERGLPAFPIPPDIGGRYSVFTAVGLLPAALAGIPIDEILDGAQSAQQEMRRAGATEENAPLWAATAAVHLYRTRSKNVLVLFVYARGLRETAAWFVQLWAESLGKQALGQTPLAALGATDQHSVLQLLQEGPADKLIWFVHPEHWRRDPTIPAGWDDGTPLDNCSLGELIRAEREGVQAALEAAGRPLWITSLPGLTPAAIGSLYFQMMTMTVYGAIALGVNPFDQPGVERGKEEALRRLRLLRA